MYLIFPKIHDTTHQLYYQSIRKETIAVSKLTLISKYYYFSYTKTK